MVQKSLVEITLPKVMLTVFPGMKRCSIEPLRKICYTYSNWYAVAYLPLMILQAGLLWHLSYVSVITISIDRAHLMLCRRDLTAKEKQYVPSSELAVKFETC